MLKIAVFLSLLYLIGADQPIGTKQSQSAKQFRYVEEDESHQPSAQKQEADRYGNPKTHDSQYLPHNGPDIHRGYAVNDKQQQEDPRPIVSVNKQDTPLGRNVGVGVNLGPIYQMDLNRENNFGSKAVNLGLSVLNGLVKVNLQRDRDPISGRRGPILVQVGGHTVYSN